MEERLGMLVRNKAEMRLPNLNDLVSRLNPAQKAALLNDERALECLDTSDRDSIVALGLVKRSRPEQNASGQWRTWITPLGCSARDMLTIKI